MIGGWVIVRRKGFWRRGSWKAIWTLHGPAMTRKAARDRAAAWNRNP